MKKSADIKYTNSWLEIVFIVFLYFAIVLSMSLARISLLFWFIPAFLAFWKLFSYQIIFNKALKGIKHYRNNEYEKSVDMFNKCLEKVHKYPFIDKFRFTLFFNTTRISFKSIFYSHIINSYSMLENNEKCIEWIKRFIADEPNSVLAKLRAEEICIKLPDYYNSKDYLDILYHPKTFSDIIQVVVVLFLVYMIIINNDPLTAYIFSLAVIGGYFFWKFIIFKMFFPEETKARKSKNIDEQIKFYEKCLERIEENKYLDRFRSVLFLNINKISYREIFLFHLYNLHNKNNDKLKANKYLHTLKKEYPDFDFEQ